MKKIIFMSLLTLVCVALTGCSSCHSDKAKQETKDVVYHDYNGVVQDFTAGVSQIQALHRQKMYGLLQDLNAKGYDTPFGYQWRNSRVVFNDTVTSANIDEVKVVAVNDVFYYWIENGDRRGPWVQYINDHVALGSQVPEPINDIWIEDDNLSETPIKLTAEDALQRLKEVNCPIPPAQSMTLRLPIGPCACNAQWVIGDVYDVLFIDAVTGDVSNWNPAFNPQKDAKGGDFGKPLGEWP